MPALINDWDSDKRQPIVLWGVQCTNCGQVQKAGMPDPPKGWEEARTPNADGRFPVRCPDCRTS